MKECILGEVAHARAGDKGDSSILFLAPFHIADFGWIRNQVTHARLAVHFAIAGVSTIRIREIEGLGALSIVIPHRLDGGVTRSATADPHGKTLSGHLLEMRIDGRPSDDRPVAP